MQGRCCSGCGRGRRVRHLPRNAGAVRRRFGPVAAAVAGLLLVLPSEVLASDSSHAGCHCGGPDVEVQASAATSAPAIEPQPSTQTGSIIDTELRVDFKITPAYGPDEERLPLVAGQLADVRLRISDAQTGAPVSALQPAV